MMISGRRLCLLVVAAAFVPLLTGCIRMQADMSVEGDGSSRAMMKMGVLASAVTPGSNNPFTELKDATGGAKWTVREYKEGEWLWAEAKGSAGPGISLFPENNGAGLAVKTSKRRLATRYDISFIMPETPKGPLGDQPKPATGKPTDDGGMAAQMGPQMEMLTQSLMESMKFDFSLSGPGYLLSSTGQPKGRSGAVWHLTGATLKEQKAPVLRIVTEAVDWEVIGRLGAQMATDGHVYDGGGRIYLALERGLLPNPSIDQPAAAKLKAADYGMLLSIIGRLDAALGPQATARVIKQAGLNRDDLTSAQVQTAFDRLANRDLASLVEKAAGDAVLEVLRAK